MADIDPELAALEAKNASLDAELNQLPTATPSEGYSLKQLGYDVTTGPLKAFTGVADLITTPAVALTRKFGYDVPYFPISTMLEQDLAAIAPQYGLREKTIPQEIASFVTPVGKEKKVAQAVSGLASYLGVKAAQEYAPESPGLQLAASLVAPAALKTGTKLIGATAPKLTEQGRAMQRAAVGFGKGDYVKTSGKRQAVQTAAGDTISLTQSQADNVIDKGFLGRSSNPGKQLTTLDANIDQTNQTISDLIQDVSGPVKTPQFIDVVRANQKAAFGGENENRIAAAIADLKSRIDRFKGAEKLEYIQQEKKNYGSKYDPKGITGDAKFNRAIYHELQKHIERYVPEVKPLNKDLQGMLLTRPVVATRQAADMVEKGKLVKNLVKFFLYTSGGGGIPFLAGATGGIPAGALLGAGLGALSTPTGMKLTGGTLRGAGSLAESIGSFAPGITRPATSAVVSQAAEPTTNAANLTAPQITTGAGEDDLEAMKAELQALEAQTQPTQTTTIEPAESIKVGKQDVSIPVGEQYAPPALVKAVMRVESAGKPKAVSEKGAAGLMQLMPGTAKDLGVKDKFDPTQNVEGGSRYLQKQIETFGNEELGLAAYNWGPGNLQKVIDKLKAEKIPVTWQNVQQVERVPAETRGYVGLVKYLDKYDDYDLAKIAGVVGPAKLDKVLAKYKTGKKFTVGDVLDDLNLSASKLNIKRSNVLQSASNLTEA